MRRSSGSGWPEPSRETPPAISEDGRVIGAGDATRCAIARCMGGELGSRGLHVRLVCIDSPFEAQHARTRVAAHAADAGRDCILNHEHVAEPRWALQRRPGHAWTVRLDLRRSVGR